METALHYFFSTEAQCLAAITGLLLVAAQFRIQYLDGRVADTKRALLHSIVGDDSPMKLEFQMAAMTSSKALDYGRSLVKTADANDPHLPFCNALEGARKLIRFERKRASGTIRILLVLLVCSLTQLPLSSAIASLPGAIPRAIIAANLIAFGFASIKVWRVAKSSFFVKKGGGR